MSIPITKLPEKPIAEFIKDARESIGLLSAQMQTVMTDGSDGDKYQAVSMRVVNQWFDILDKKAQEPTQPKASTIENNVDAK